MQTLGKSVRCLQHSVKALALGLMFFTMSFEISAHPLCPNSDSHQLSAHRYKMFTAYQTAYDGYQAPCELKCFEKAECLSSCQEKKALESLSSHFKKELDKTGLAQCQSLTQVCVEECGADKKSCESACRS